jgi:hypothetical protein
MTNNPYYTNLKRPAYNDFYNAPKFNPQQFDTGNPQYQQQGNWFQNNPGATSDQSGAGTYIAAAASMMPNTKDGQFSIDRNAGFKGSGEGLASGGVIGAVVGGVTKQWGQQSEVKKALNNLDTSVQGVQYDAYGRPSYGGASVIQAQSNIDELNKGEASMKGGIDPATSVFSMANKRRIRRKRSELKTNMIKAQQTYNQADVSNRSQMNSLEDYYQRKNPTNRMYNIYNRYNG